MAYSNMIFLLIWQLVGEESWLLMSRALVLSTSSYFPIPFSYANKEWLAFPSSQLQSKQRPTNRDTRYWAIPCTWEISHTGSGKRLVIYEEFFYVMQLLYRHRNQRRKRNRCTNVVSVLQRACTLLTFCLSVHCTVAKGCSTYRCSRRSRRP